MTKRKKTTKKRKSARVAKPIRTAEQQAFLEAFGDHVKKIRMSKDYSQDRVYLEGNLSRGTMSRIELGQVDVQIWTLVRIADTIGVPLRKLVDFERDENFNHSAV